MKEHFTFQNLALTFIMGMMIWGMTAIISLEGRTSTGLASLEARFDARLASLEARFDSAFASLKETDLELKAEIRELGNRLTRIEVEVKDLGNRLARVEVRLDALEKRFDDFVNESRARAGMATK